MEHLKDTDVTWIKEVIDWDCPKCDGRTLFNLKNNHHYCEKCAHLIAIVPKEKGIVDRLKEIQIEMQNAKKD